MEASVFYKRRLLIDFGPIGKSILTSLCALVFMVCFTQNSQAQNATHKITHEKLVPGTPAYATAKTEGNLQNAVVPVKSTGTQKHVVNGFGLQKSVSGAGCYIPHDSDSWTELSGNDDGSTSEITLPFTFNFYGESYNSVYINNNGNITFNNTYSSYTPSGFPVETPMIAAFWGDVDTRPPESGNVWYMVTDHALYVDFPGVGYYDEQTDLLNTFNIVITDGSSSVPEVGEGNNVAFFYGDMQWTTGSASGGSGGFGGSAATVGANSGNGTDYFQVGRFDMTGGEFNGAYGDPSGVDWLDFSCFTFDVTGEGLNIAPVLQDISSQSATLCVGETTEIEWSFTGPEEAQTVTVELTDPDDVGEITSSETGDGTTSGVLELTGTTPGEYTVSLVATDDGDPAASTTTDEINLTVESCGTEFDCPDLEANIGDSCDDGDPDTENDVVTENCGCAGTPIVICDADGGTISTNSETTVCVGDGEDDFVVVTLEGNEGDNGVWVITDSDLNILMTPVEQPSGGFNFENAGVGVCNIWFLSYADDVSLEGIDNAGDLTGCYDLSNPIEVTRQDCGEEFDCPELEANIGDSCDDGDPDTENDVVTENCGCTGTPIEVTECDPYEAPCPANGVQYFASSAASGECSGDYNHSFYFFRLFNQEGENGNYLVKMDFLEGQGYLNVLDGDMAVLQGRAEISSGGDLSANSGYNWNHTKWDVYIPLQATSDAEPKLELNGDCSTPQQEASSDWSYWEIVPYVSGPNFMRVSDNEGSCSDEFNSDSFDIMDASSTYKFQVGTGANGKNLEFGASDWFTLQGTLDMSGNGCGDCETVEAIEGRSSGQDGDINIDLEPNDDCGSPGDEACENYRIFYASHGSGISGTNLYSVELNGANADMTLLINVDYKAHIAFNEFTNTVYLVDEQGGFIDVYDVEDGTIDSADRITLESGIAKITTAVYNNAESTLYIGDSQNNEVLTVDLSDGSHTLFADNIPVSGGDLSLSNGKLFLATRAGDKLYSIIGTTLSEVGGIDANVNGMATLDNSNLLTANKGNSAFLEIDDDANSIGSYQAMLSGSSFQLKNGDLAAGCSDNSGGDIGGCNDFRYYYIAYNSPGYGQGTVFEGAINGGDFELTELFTTGFDAHLGVNADASELYVVALNGDKVETYDLSGNLLNNASLSGLSRLTAVVYNPIDQLLYVGSENANEIYTIDPVTGTSNLFASNVPVSGGDLVLDNSGQLYLIERDNNNPSRVYEISGGSANQVFEVTPSANGAALTASNGFIVAEGENSNSFWTYANDGSGETQLNAVLGGNPFPVVSGDMASGCFSGNDPDIPPTGNCTASCITSDGYVEGVQANGSMIPANRSDANQALGQPEGDDSENFVSLGYGGSITLCFDGAVMNGEGDDIQIVETSFGDPSCSSYPEYADIEVSQDGSTWYTLETICLDGAVDISDASVELDYITQVRISNNDDLTQTPDGYDVDGVVVLSGPCNEEEVPGLVAENETQKTSASKEAIKLGAYPNPTQGQANVTFTVPVDTHVKVEVYSTSGVRVATLYNSYANARQDYDVDFDGSNLTPGLYFYRLTTANGETKPGKILINR